MTPHTLLYEPCWWIMHAASACQRHVTVLVLHKALFAFLFLAFVSDIGADCESELCVFCSSREGWNGDLMHHLCFRSTPCRSIEVRRLRYLSSWWWHMNEVRTIVWILACLFSEINTFCKCVGKSEAEWSGHGEIATSVTQYKLWASLSLLSVPQGLWLLAEPVWNKTGLNLCRPCVCVWAHVSVNPVCRTEPELTLSLHVLYPRHASTGWSVDERCASENTASSISI